MSKVKLYTGDCLEVMPTLPAKSVHAIVCDPPYGLGFMGQDWDHGVPGVHFWEAALRVAMPGAHLLAFGGTRTFHRLACAIEDAGWQLRDTIAWVYGSGFPKSVNIAKAIDKRRTEDEAPIREVCRAVRAAMKRQGLKARDLTGYFGDCHPRLIDHWAARDTDSQPSLPTWEQWLTLRSVLGMGHELDGLVRRLNERKGTPGDTWQQAPIVGEYPESTMGLVGKRFNVRDKFMRAPSEDAAKWEGWGTGLKPAWEPIIMARKPVEGTVAANVLRYGTGALNIAGNMVGDEEVVTNRYEPGKDMTSFRESHAGDDYVSATHDGRWPANFVHDGSDEVMALFPETESNSGNLTFTNGTNPNGIYGERIPWPTKGITDKGSAARFFYVAKASPADRDDGLEDLPDHPASERVEREEGSAGMRSPRAGAGRMTPGKNHHKTVKPTELMRHLVRLVTPPGGVVLDPFCGSGSTGRGAVFEDFDFIGIDREPDFVELSKRRIRAAFPPLFAPDLSEM